MICLLKLKKKYVFVRGASISNNIGYLRYFSLYTDLTKNYIIVVVIVTFYSLSGRRSQSKWGNVWQREDGFELGLGVGRARPQVEPVATSLMSKLFNYDEFPLGNMDYENNIVMYSIVYTVDK